MLKLNDHIADVIPSVGIPHADCAARRRSGCRSALRKLLLLLLRRMQSTPYDMMISTTNNKHPAKPNHVHV